MVSRPIASSPGTSRAKPGRTLVRALMPFNCFRRACADAVALGHGAQAFAFLELVREPGGQRLVLRFVALQVVEKGLDLFGRQHQRAVRLGRHHRPAVGGIECDEVGHRYFGQARGEGHIHGAVAFDGAEVGTVRNRIEIDAEQLRLGDDVLDRLQLGHVIARLVGHFQALVVGRQSLCLVLRDGATDGVFAPVVGGQRQMPVAVHFVDVLQVVERGIGRGDDVAALIEPPVLLQVVGLAGRGNELPHAEGARRRIGQGIEGAFDDGQQGQLGRHAALFQFAKRYGGDTGGCARRCAAADRAGSDTRPGDRPPAGCPDPAWRSRGACAATNRRPEW